MKSSFRCCAVSLRSRRQHKAWGVSPRKKVARGLGAREEGDSSWSAARFTGWLAHLTVIPGVPLTLHPRLYANARFAGWCEGLSKRLLTRARHQILILAAMLFTILAFAQTTQAHAQQGEANGFLTGFRHPISGWDHVLAMIAVGLWGAQLGPPAVWLLPVTFPVVMAFGGMLGLMGIPIPGIEIGIAASAIMLGVAVASELKPRLAIAAVLIAFFAIFHGHAHGTELPAGESGLLYSMGFVIATGCLHATGVGIGLIHRWSWGQWTLRVAGGGVALAGAFFMWRAFA